MSSKLDKIKGITDRLNRAARKANPDREEPVAFVAAGNEALMDLGTLPTGNPAVDGAIAGGFPRGTIGMLAGPDGTGKSRLALDMIAFNQTRDPEFVALFVHLEARAFPLHAAIDAGVDLERLLVLNAQQSGEKTFDAMVEYLWDWDRMVPVNAIDLAVVDSVAAAAPEDELKAVRDEGFSKHTVGRQAAMMSKVLRDLSGCGALGRAVLLLINQVRVDIGGYGAPETMPGGKPIGHYPKITVRLRKGDPIKEGEKQIGHEIKGKVTKNNSGRGLPQTEFSYRIVYGVGVDRLGPLVDRAIELEIIRNPKSGSFEIERDGNVAKLRGRANLNQIIQDDPDLLAWLEERVASA